MERFIESFDEYTSEFDMKNDLIRSRYHHSYRVMELSKKLAYQLELNEEDIYLATIIGLLHDYGRFEQIKEYNTLDDNTSVDHAEQGIYYLFNKNHIRFFVDNPALYLIIRKSIQYHNKYALPHRGLTKRERMHMKIIRDADKLDILYLIGVLKDVKINITNEEISDSVSKSFYQKRSVDKSDIKTDNDKVISWLAYIYDLNYRESFEYLKRIHLLEIFYENLDRPEILKQYFDYIIKYVERKVK